MIITIKDESLSGDLIHEQKIDMASPRATVREIISQRVTQEVEAYNKKSHTRFSGLITPTQAEASLNPRKKPKFVDAEKQVYVALDAFQKNGFFVLINNTQADTLDEVIELNKQTVISFVKLTPLVGG